MVTEAQKRAANKWSAANMTVLGCKVRKDYAERVRACCEANGDTVNAVLRSALDDYLERHERQKPPKDN